MFEAMAIKVLLACANVSKATGLLGLHWEAVHTIIKRAVERGLDRRSLEGMTHVGMDEKSFGKGHDYVSVLTDLDHHRVLEVAPERTIEASDKVRRCEHRELLADGDERLPGSRQLLLYNADNLDEDRIDELLELQQSDLKTGRDWTIKEHFRHFWVYVYPGSAKRFFERWYNWAIRSRLEPIKKVARMLKRHLPGLLSYFRHQVTNAIAEGFNSRIQSIKSSARGFRNFANYRLRILFHCGKLHMLPETCNENP